MSRMTNALRNLQDDGLAAVSGRAGELDVACLDGVDAVAAMVRDSDDIDDEDLLTSQGESYFAEPDVEERFEIVEEEVSEAFELLDNDPPTLESLLEEEAVGRNESRAIEGITTEESDCQTPQVVRASRVEVSEEVGRLRKNVLADMSQLGDSPGGRLIGLATLDAGLEVSQVVAELARSLVGVGQGDVLALEVATSWTATDSEEFAKTHGWTSLLDGTRQLADVVQPTATPGLAVVCGGIDKGEWQRFEVGGVERTLAECREHFAFGVLDLGNVAGEPARRLARHLDGLYLVIREGMLDVTAARRAISDCERAGAPMRGSIVIADD